MTDELGGQWPDVFRLSCFRHGWQSPFLIAAPETTTGQGQEPPPASTISSTFNSVRDIPRGTSDSAEPCGQAGASSGWRGSLEHDHPRRGCASIREGLDETLTVQRLGSDGGAAAYADETTKGICIENLNGSVEQLPARNVKYAGVVAR